jgi:hypothetical protein
MENLRFGERMQLGATGNIGPNVQSGATANLRPTVQLGATANMRPTVQLGATANIAAIPRVQVRHEAEIGVTLGRDFNCNLKIYLFKER